MATLRKGVCYRFLKRPYTRKSKYKKSNFISTVPENKVVKFNIGNCHKDFKYKVTLVSREDHNIRHNALESVRQVINRDLQKAIGNEYYFVMNAFPHHVLRENKMLTGAGADRMQTGMSHAFGKAVGRAARLKKGDRIITIRVDDAGLRVLKVSLKKIIPKLPSRYSIQITESK